MDTCIISAGETFDLGMITPCLFFLCICFALLFSLFFSFQSIAVPVPSQPGGRKKKKHVRPSDPAPALDGHLFRAGT